MFWTDFPVRDAVRRSRRPLVGLVAVVAVASFGASSTPAIVSVADSELPVSPGDRVLQSVRVAMGPDGTLTEVEGTTVTASADGEESDSVSQAYSPDDVVADLPVRVLTSYRTADGSGTDLSDLEGYDGTVHIDLTVENLTVQAEELSYDVAGASRSRQALVGAPLTVVASADLGSVAPNTVVTQRAGEDDVTNGVLSQGADGATQVQWATILAPPQLSSSATLSLVMDAKDFATPGFDLSVQPGLVTDPSVGALVQQAFNPAASDEMELQAATIEAVGEVNDVLAEAGDSISDVRRSLTSATATLGEKTVGDLETSVVQIAASMKSLDGTVNGLGDAISSALESTGSSSLAQLESTVSSIDTLLGDTSGRPGTAPVSGGGCNATVPTGKSAETVYGSLLQVAGTLNGYASASDACKQKLKYSILTSIGPDEPSDQICQESTDSFENPFADSVTCSIFWSKLRFGDIATTLITDGATAVNALDEAGVGDVSEAADEVDTALVELETSLKKQLNENEVVLDTSKVADQLDAVDTAAGAVRTAATALKTRAEAERSSIDTAIAQNAAAAAKVCDLAADGADGADINGIYQLLTDLPCANKTDLPAMPEVTPNNIRLTQTRSAWNDAATSAASLATSATSIATATENARTELGNLSSQPTSGRAVVEDILRALGSADSGFKIAAARTKLKDEADDVETDLATAKININGAFAKAANNATDEVDDAASDSLDNVSGASAAARKDVTDAFTTSREGMRDAAKEIAADGREEINGQKAELGRTAKAAAGDIESNVKQGLDTISDTVSASTRDTEAAGKLLTADLTKVLLDLGDPDVDGAGLLGTLGANVGDARAADFQLALATRTATSYAGARGADVAGLQLRQAQAEAAFKRQAQLPAFQVDVPEGVERRTVYTFHLAPGQ